MAIVKTLIVKGVARFLTDAYMSTIRSGIWNGSTIAVGYGGTGVTSAKGDTETPVFLASNGITPCSYAIPHNTKNFIINGTTYAVYTTYTGNATPTIIAPTSFASTGGLVLATNSAKNGLEWISLPNSNITTSAVVASTADGTTLISTALLNPFYNLIEGNSVARSIQFASSNITVSSSTAGVISFTAASWLAATSDANGVAGYMPAPTSALRTQFLRGDGTWCSLNNYSLPLAANGTRGGILIGFVDTAPDYAVKLASEKAYVTVPNNAVGVRGTVAGPTKASNPNLVWMTNSDGEPAWRNANVTAVLASTVDSTTQLTAFQANPFYNLTLGGVITRSVQFLAGSGMLVGTTDGSNIKITNNAPVYYIVGNTNDTAGVWTGNCSEITSYYDGLTIIYVPKVAGVSTGTTLKLNNLNAIDCYSTNTTKLTTHYAANTPILFTYFGGYWRRADYNSYTNTWRGIRVNNNDSDNVGTGTGTKSMNFASSSLTIGYLAAGADAGQSGNANYFTIGIEAKDWTGATENAAGTAGYMPGAASADRNKFLRGDGTWVSLSDSTHTHPLSIAADNGTSALTLVASTKYKLTAGGSTFIFTTPPNTWRNICVNGGSSGSVGTDVDTKAMNFTATGNITISYAAAGTNTGQSGSDDYFTIGINATANAVGVAGYVAAPTAANNKHNVWMTDASGNPAWRTLNLSSTATQLFSGSKSLQVDTWTTMASISSLVAGTYAIQINSGTLYASGIFTACHGTDVVIDEIVLHVANTTSGATWRPYARVSGGDLQMTTNETSGTSRTYTIKILQLI